MKRLTELRVARGLTMTKCAEVFGISQQTWCNYEKGVTEPSFEICSKIADFFDVTIDYLVGHTETNFFSNSFNNNTINSTTGGGDEMTKQLLSKFNDLDFDQKIKVFTYISNLKEK